MNYRCAQKWIDSLNRVTLDFARPQRIQERIARNRDSSDSRADANRD